MSKEELLEKEFDSAYDAMYALIDFLKEIDESSLYKTRNDYQHLRVIGNRIFE